MNEERRKRPRRWWPRIWRGLVAVGVVLFTALGLHVALTHVGVVRRLKAIRAAGYPTTLAEWTESRKLPEGTANAAEVYEEAFRLFVMPTSDAGVRALGYAMMPARDLVWSEPMLAGASRCLADNQPCLALLHKAAEVEQCRYDWSYIPTMPETEGLLQCAYLLGLDMLVHAQQNDAPGAVMCFKSALRLSDSLRCEPTECMYVIRTVRLHASLRGLEWALSATSFTDEQLRDLSDALARAAMTPGLTEALVSERCWAIEAFADPSVFRDYQTGGDSLLLRFPGVMKTGLSDTLDYTAKAIEVLKSPSPERLSKLYAIDAEFKALPFWHLVSKRTPATACLMCKMDLQLRARIDMVRAALAIERYRVATGEMPGHLDGLVSEYLDAVPIDPFDRQPIRYRVTDSGYLLYSVNDDGQDNGGKERDKEGNNGPYDLCFIVTR